MYDYGILTFITLRKYYTLYAKIPGGGRGVF